jgi:hypothetical protein
MIAFSPSILACVKGAWSAHFLVPQIFEPAERTMKVYHLSPLATDDPSWKYSVETGQIWACALTSDHARELAAARTGFFKLAEPGAVSPWRNDKVTSCIEDPTMNYPDPGRVIREDGSPVDC